MGEGSLLERDLHKKLLVQIKYKLDCSIILHWLHILRMHLICFILTYKRICITHHGGGKERRNWGGRMVKILKQQLKSTARVFADSPCLILSRQKAKRTLPPHWNVFLYWFESLHVLTFKRQYTVCLFSLLLVGWQTKRRWTMTLWLWCSVFNILLYFLFKHWETFAM